MDTTNSEPRSNSIIAAFRRGLNAFSHALRSPLSVISNDLSYWERSLGTEEVQRGRQTVTRISNLLEELERILKPLGEKSAVNIIETLEIKDFPQVVEREMDLKRFKQSLEDLNKVFPISKWSVNSSNTDLELIGVSESMPIDLKEPCTLTEYSYSKNGGIDVLKALNFDLVVSMHCGEAKLQSDGLHLRI